jgi:CheY-like chemotaxis protein
MRCELSRPLVLLVEDSEDDAFFFRWTLDKCGFACDVTHAVNGASAIDHLAAGLPGGGGRLPDLVFLDLKIPTYNGFEVLAWIHEQHFDPPLDVVVLSGSEHTSDIQRAHLLGATGYYVKPISIEQLRARFHNWTATHDSRGSAPPMDTPALAGPNGTA